MKKSLILAIGIAFFLTACSTDQKSADAGDEKFVEQPKTIAISSSVMRGTIESINYKTRTVVLKADTGKTFTKKVEDDVKNLEQLKKGDIIVATFIESVAIDIRRSDEGKRPNISEFTYVDVNHKDKVPYKLKAKVIEAKAVVVDIDYSKRFITVRGPEGIDQSFLVDKSVTDFNKIKKNDDIVVTYTESVTFIVEKKK